MDAMYLNSRFLNIFRDSIWVHIVRVNMNF